MNIVKVKLSELKPDPNNARTHSRANIDAVKASLKEHGQYRPFVVQNGTGRICVGNCMYTAMMELGMTEGWAEYRELSDRQFVRLSVTDNRTSELGTWDENLLAHVRAEEFELPGWDEDISVHGFDAPLGVQPTQQAAPQSTPSSMPQEPVHIFGEELNAGMGQPDSRRTYGMLDGENTTVGVMFGDTEIRLKLVFVQEFLSWLENKYKENGLSVADILTEILKRGMASL